MLHFRWRTNKFGVFTSISGLKSTEFGLDAPIDILSSVYPVAASLILRAHLVVELSDIIVEALAH